MNLRTTETAEKTPPVVQTPTEQPIVSNYPRGGYAPKLEGDQQSVFRQSLTAIGKHPFLYWAAAIIATVIGVSWTNFLPIVIGTLTTTQGQIGWAFASIIWHVLGKMVQCHAANEIAKPLDAEQIGFASMIKRSSAWGSTLLLALMTFAVSVGVSFGTGLLSSPLNLSSVQIPVLMTLLATPLGAIITCRFIFAPFIAANRGIGAFGSLRESVLMTQGIGFKAAGWTMLFYFANSVASWMSRTSIGIFGYLAYLIPLFLYVNLGVWYFRRARHLQLNQH